MANIVKEGDLISYIQDVTDVDALRAIYNFQLSALDEGGYDQDPTTDPDETRFSQVTTQKYTGFYALLFDNPSGQAINIDTVDAIDISGQFDILISFTPDRTQFIDGNSEPLVWSFSDANEGLEIGISGENATESSWRGFVRIVHGGAFDVITGANQLIMRDTGGNSDPIFIRVSRGQDNIIRLFINGEEDGTFTTGDSLQPTTVVPMIFGNGRGNNDQYSGLIHQVRVYCGENLSNSQATLIRQAKPIPFSMRFRGRIWQIKDNEVSTTAYAQADSFELLSGTLGATDADPTNIVIHDLTTESYKDILQSAVNNVKDLNVFTVKAKDTFAYNNTISTLPAIQIGNILEVGTFVDFANILFDFSYTRFYVTPRNVLVVEDRDGKQTNFVFEQKDNELNPDVAAPYNITVNKINDTNLGNDLTLISLSGAKDRVRNFASINDIKRAKRKNVEQLDDSFDLDSYSLRLLFLLRNNDTDVPKNKFIVKITSLINSIRPNQIVNIINNRKNIDLNEIISQVTYSYPSEHTIINVGEVTLDYYNDIENMIITSDELVDTNLTTVIPP